MGIDTIRVRAKWVWEREWNLGGGNGDFAAKSGSSFPLPDCRDFFLFYRFAVREGDGEGEGEGRDFFSFNLSP